MGLGEVQGQEAGRLTVGRDLSQEEACHVA